MAAKTILFSARTSKDLGRSTMPAVSTARPRPNSEAELESEPDFKPKKSASRQPFFPFMRSTSFGAGDRTPSAAEDDSASANQFLDNDMSEMSPLLPARPSSCHTVSSSASTTNTGSRRTARRSDACKAGRCGCDVCLILGGFFFNLIRLRRVG